MDVRPEQAGAGSAVNDATRELGGTLGVAVIGSVFASLYRAHLAGGTVTGVPATAVAAARSSFGAGQAASAHLAAHAGGPLGARLHAAVTSGFMSGLHAGCATGAGVCLAGAVGALCLLPSRPAVAVGSRSAGESEAAGAVVGVPDLVRQ